MPLAAAPSMRNGQLAMVRAMPAITSELCLRPNGAELRRADVAGIVCAMSTDTLYRIRATRADPPGHASNDEARRQVYGAALAQFDELIGAARAVGPASRPLPLFYALSQAGRALAAARAEKTWRLRGHGLSAPQLGASLLDVEIKRSGNASGRDNDAGREAEYTDSYTAAAFAAGSDAFPTAARIGELWRSLPEAYELLPQLSSTHPVPLRLVPRGEDPVQLVTLDRGHASAILVGVDRPLDELDDYLRRHYPASAGMAPFIPFHGQPVAPHHSPFGPGWIVRWRVDAQTDPDLVRIAQRLTRRSEVCWLRPAVGGVALSPLLTWWALLFGLSMLARYEPAAWVAHIDYDTSPFAAPVGRLMDIGLERVPELVLDALSLRRDETHA